ncbi:hypothetical protein AVEN_125168-1 [Araneus ventricosus]|uniref:Uncharacterized protein n=1 Tax=Araneus ventricosus TaxID=182803 RepID=A0A4Y2QS03_ARAVE|nr:hypothetical protein AVEN_125168-1 [Araneus ventricosus]
MSDNNDFRSFDCQCPLHIRNALGNDNEHIFQTAWGALSDYATEPIEELTFFDDNLSWEKEVNYLGIMPTFDKHAAQIFKKFWNQFYLIIPLIFRNIPLSLRNYVLRYKEAFDNLNPNLGTCRKNAQKENSNSTK